MCSEWSRSALSRFGLHWWSSRATVVASGAYVVHYVVTTVDLPAALGEVRSRSTDPVQKALGPYVVSRERSRAVAVRTELWHNSRGCWASMWRRIPHSAA